ncbi:MAG TPA: type II toxin-antitoxin system HicA family toxin [Rhodocyclaceae bacterium]
MSHKHHNLLRTIFQDPISSNIHWREVESLLNHLGATVEPAHGARFRVVLNRAEAFLHHPHHSNVCDKQDIKHLREFLAHAGITPSSYEAGRE